MILIDDEAKRSKKVRTIARLSGFFNRIVSSE